jgi:hypothetical protein
MGELRSVGSATREFRHLRRFGPPLARCRGFGAKLDQQDSRSRGHTRVVCRSGNRHLHFDGTLRETWPCEGDFGDGESQCISLQVAVRMDDTLSQASYCAAEAKVESWET